MAATLVTDINLIRILGEHNLPERFQNYYNLPEGEFQQRAAEFRQWCKDNGVFYYARPKESFHNLEAMRLAKEAGCTSLIMENMS